MPVTTAVQASGTHLYFLRGVLHLGWETRGFLGEAGRGNEPSGFWSPSCCGRNKNCIFFIQAINTREQQPAQQANLHSAVPAGITLHLASLAGLSLFGGRVLFQLVAFLGYFFFLFPRLWGRGRVRNAKHRDVHTTRRTLSVVKKAKLIIMMMTVAASPENR